MTSARFQAIEEVFHQALDCEPGRLRAFLDQSCAGDEDLRGKVEALLTSHRQAKSFIETSIGAAAADIVGQTQLPRIGRATPSPRMLGNLEDYELLEEIARGGQGVVYRAHQKSLNRTVALKVIGLGPWSTEAHLKRFRREAEAAAGLDHPGIVPIYEVSECEGYCYFSMKFIEGGQLDEVVKREPIPIRRAVELIAKVARTAHHAHEHGILHRDIKPGNILLDEQGEPHLTDFGLARLIEAESTLTRTLDVMGTPSYMSPEQATGETPKLTKAADIYGLGAVLYELLTDHAPFVGGTSYETIRLVLDTEPRQPRLWNPKITRELSAICLKCLEKDPKRRYSSAVALAEDLEHWLRHEPIQARHTGLFTRGRKWVRRNPGTAGLITLLVALAAGSGVVVNANLERNQKMQQALVRLAQVEAQSKQPGEKLTPEEQRARAYAVLEKELGLSAGTLAKEIPGFALELYSRSDTTPLVRARAAYALNKLDEAEKLSLEAGEQGQRAYESAKRVADERRKAALDAYELAGWSAEKRVQYGDALEHLRKAQQLTDRARDPLEWGRVQFAISWILFDQGQYQQVESVLRELLKERERLLGPEHPDSIAVRHYIARAIAFQGRYPEAEGEYRTVLKLRDKLLGPEHPGTVATRSGLAVVLDFEGKYPEAETEYREVLKLREKVLGPEHPHTLQSRNNLAVVLMLEGKYVEAEAEYRAVLKLFEKVLGPEHPDTVSTRNNFGNVLQNEGKYAEAEAEYRAVLKLLEKVLGPEHPDTVRTHMDLATVFDLQGKYAEAETEARAAIAIEQNVLGPEHPLTLETRDTLADAFAHESRYVDAEAEYREVLNLRQKVLGLEHPETLVSRSELAMVIAKQQRYDEAEGIFSDVLPKLEKASGTDHPYTLDLCYSYAECLKAQGKLAQAKEFAQRAAEGALKAFGPDHPDTKKYENLWRDLETSLTRQ